MGRRYVRTTTRGNYDPHDMFQAIRAVKLEGKSLRSVGKEFGINYRTLMYHAKKFKEEDIKEDCKVPWSVSGYKSSRQVIPPEQELKFAEYLSQLSKVYIGLTHKDVRKLGYEWSIANNIKVPANWSAAQIAGCEWCTYFLKRHPTLSITSSDDKRLATVACFNKENANTFYNKLQALIAKYKLMPDNMWNMDQIGICTTDEPNRTVPRRSLYRPIEYATRCDEPREMVSITVTISAAGNTVPPMFIFPQECAYKRVLLRAPEGSCGMHNSSRWMKTEHFIEYLKHFASVTKCTKEEPCLLMLDNNSSPLSMDVLKYAEINGIIMLAFPSRCSLKLQPLDRTVFESFKEFIEAACKKWIRFNEGKNMTIEHIPRIVESIYALAFSSSNIQNGFKICGIHPFNREAVSQAECTLIPVPVDTDDEKSEAEELELDQINGTNDSAFMNKKRGQDFRAQDTGRNAGPIISSTSDK